ncbi:MAG: vitamin K epoxide reductase family protein [Bacteroidota bacterium]
MKEAVDYLLNRLLHKNDIRIDQEELALQLQSHPSYPSLHSLTDVLSHFKINNLALRLPTEASTLEQMPKVFMATVQVDGVKHLTLIERQKNGVHVTYQSRKKQMIAVAQFLKQWNGIVLVIEKDEQTREVKENTSYDFLQHVGWGFIVLIMAGLVWSKATYFAGFHFALSLIGGYLSLLIVRYELGWQSTTSNQLCNLSERTSCDAVFHSKGASLFGKVKLVDLCVLSFATYSLHWLLLFLVGQSASALVAVLSLGALPFVVYSLYYQSQIIRKWCPLCLGIVTVLLLQALSTLLLPSSLEAWRIAWEEVVYWLATFTMVALAWASLSKILRKQSALKTAELKLVQFKRSYAVFKAFYRYGIPLATNIDLPGEIVLGNPQAKLQLTIVTSPKCRYCREVHQGVERLLQRAKEDFGITIRFATNTNQPEEEHYQLLSQLLFIYQKQGPSACRQAMDVLYDEYADHSAWLQTQTKIPDDEIQNYNLVLDWQREWGHDNKINFTPAVYLNGNQYPKEYELADLAYFKDDLLKEINAGIQVVDQPLQNIG